MLKMSLKTPLMLAATKSSVDVIKALLDAGADPLLKNKDGWNVFHIACREGHVPVLELLLKHSPLIWDTKSHNLRSPLHTAGIVEPLSDLWNKRGETLHGRQEVISWLFAKCTYDVDAVDCCGVTPLMDALRAGHVATAAVLLEDFKAKPDVQDKMGRRVIHQVCQAGQVEALDFLISTTKTSVNVASELTGEVPIHTAAKEGQHELIEKLIHYGADINCADCKGRTALHIASGSQHCECVQALLRHGALILTDNSGTKPVDLARKEQIKELFKFDS